MGNCREFRGFEILVGFIGFRKRGRVWFLLGLVVRMFRLLNFGVLGLGVVF